MAELKPCPFCGAKETDKDQPINIGWVYEDDAWMVVCDRCGASGAEHDGRAEAIEAWNMRVPQTEVNQYGENCTNITNCGTLNLRL